MIREECSLSLKTLDLDRSILGLLTKPLVTGSDVRHIASSSTINRSIAAVTLIYTLNHTDQRGVSIQSALNCLAMPPTSPESNFSSIPILDWSLLATDEGHAKFVEQLRYALIHVGFLYLSNPPVSREDMDALVEYTPRLFDLPQTEKDHITMANSPHFFGYSRLGAELTKGKTDQREQFDFGTPYENLWTSGDPEYLKLWGPPQASNLLLSEKRSD